MGLHTRTCALVKYRQLSNYQPGNANRTKVVYTCTEFNVSPGCNVAVLSYLQDLGIQAMKLTTAKPS